VITDQPVVSLVGCPITVAWNGIL